MNKGLEFARKIDLVYHQQCKSICKELNLPQTAFNILMFLGNHPEYKSARDIVEIRKIKANLVSVNVDKLVNEGYLKRLAIPGDRRKIKLVCSEKAKLVIKKGQQFQKKFFQTMWQGIDANKQALFYETLQMIEKNLDELKEAK